MNENDLNLLCTKAAKLLLKNDVDGYQELRQGIDPRQLEYFNAKLLENIASIHAAKKLATQQVIDKARAELAVSRKAVADAAFRLWGQKHI